MKLLKDASKVLAPAGYDIEIVEKHHNQKVDAPSGTALALADSINEAMDDVYSYTYDRSQERKKMCIRDRCDREWSYDCRATWRGRRDRTYLCEP